MAGEPVSLDILIRNVIVVQELRRVLTTFKTAGIPVIVFKGPVLSQMLQGDPRLRVMSDVDFLIHPDDRGTLIQVLREIGYAVVESYPSEITLDFLWQFGSAFAARRQVNDVMVHLDIHEHPINQQWYKLGTAIDLDALWADSRPFLLDGQELGRQFGPEHTLIHLGLHWAAHGFVGWRRAQEIAEVARAYPPEWEKLIREAIRFRLKTTVYWALALVQHKDDAAVPPEVVEALCPGALRRWLLGKLAGVKAVQRDEIGPNDKSRVFIHFALLDGLTDLLRVLRFTFLPGSAWLMRRYDTPSRYRVAVLYLKHWKRVVHWGIRGVRQVWQRGVAKASMEGIA